MRPLPSELATPPVTNRWQVLAAKYGATGAPRVGAGRRPAARESTLTAGGRPVPSRRHARDDRRRPAGTATASARAGTAAPLSLTAKPTPAATPSAARPARSRGTAPSAALQRPGRPHHQQHGGGDDERQQRGDRRVEQQPEDGLGLAPQHLARGAVDDLAGEAAQVGAVGGRAQARRRRRRPRRRRPRPARPGPSPHHRDPRPGQPQAQHDEGRHQGQHPADVGAQGGGPVDRDDAPARRRRRAARAGSAGRAAPARAARRPRRPRRRRCRCRRSGRRPARSSPRRCRAAGGRRWRGRRRATAATAAQAQPSGRRTRSSSTAPATASARAVASSAASGAGARHQGSSCAAYDAPSTSTPASPATLAAAGRRASPTQQRELEHQDDDEEGHGRRACPRRRAGRGRRAPATLGAAPRTCHGWPSTAGGTAAPIRASTVGATSTSWTYGARPVLALTRAPRGKDGPVAAATCRCATRSPAASESPTTSRSTCSGSRSRAAPTTASTRAAEASRAAPPPTTDPASTTTTGAPPGARADREQGARAAALHPAVEGARQQAELGAVAGGGVARAVLRVGRRGSRCRARGRARTPGPGPRRPG